MPETTPDAVPSPAVQDAGGFSFDGVMMSETTPDLVPSSAPKESGGVGATPSAEAVEAFLMAPKVQAPHDAARDWADLSGRWGHRHSAPIPEGLAGLGARGQEPLTPGPTLAELKEELVRRDVLLAQTEEELVRAQRLADSRTSEMRRRDEAIVRLEGLLRSAEEERYAAQHQLREALAELAAMRGHSPDAGKVVNG